ncbi:MAG: ABC transporter substrate-binding protein [Oscillospiraceae bacterium]|nr:ABC transporter substrate-binding protein [Oscillospiraceae bacterium]
MKSGIRFAALLVLALLAIALGACSGDRGAEQPEDGNGPSVTDGEGALILGGEIVVGIAQDLDSSLDPHEMVAAGTAGTREVMFNVFEGLVKPNPDGELIPAVAESFVIDGTIYTFTLREGVRFHNGDPVTVEDIVYSIERGADEGETATFVSALSVVTRVETRDEWTVEIEIEEPDNAFLAHLTLPIIPRNHADHGRNPVGTGPFRFVSYSPQESLVLERFEDYWGHPAYLDRVTFRIYGSGDVLVMALNAGAIDLAAHLTVDMVDQLSDDFVALEGPMSLVQALYLNHAVEPLDKLEVRQALSYAVDIREIMAILAGGRGHPTGSSIHPAFTRYFNEELVDFYPHDPDRARALLAEAGYPDGFDLEITVPGNYTPHVITAEVLVEQLRAVGVNATIRLVEWTYWVSEVNVGRQFESTVIGFAARDLTARSALERFVSDNRRNLINFNSPAYDAVFAEALTETDDARRIQLYRELQAILAREAANVYLQDLVNMVAIRRDLAGFQFYPIYVMNLATVHFIA